MGVRAIVTPGTHGDTSTQQQADMVWQVCLVS